MRYSSESYREYLDWKVNSMLAVLAKHRVDIAGAKLLDFGCQHGTSVEALRRAGLDAYGFDVGIPCDTGVIRRSTIENYRIPWPDSTFDIAFSHHVLEHVQDHDAAISELRRVLKPDGLMLHVFPSRWRVLEAHFYTPFGGVFNNVWWCTLWSWLRKPGRKHIPLIEYGRLASHTIRTEMNYPPRRELMAAFQRAFTVEDVLADYFQQLKGKRLPAPAARALSELHVRVLLCRPT